MRRKTLAVAFFASLGSTVLMTTVPVRGQQAPADQPIGHPKLQYMQGARVPRPAGIVSGSPVGLSQFGFSPTDNLDGGPFAALPFGVFHHPRVYLIFWSPNNTISQPFKDLLVRFNNDLHDTPFANILTQYYDNDNFIVGKDFITTDIQLAGTFTDTSTSYNTYNGHVGTPGDPLVDNDIQQEVEHARSVNGWPSGFDNFYAVFTERDVESCADSSNCTPGTANPVFCAYHSVFLSGLSPVMYANMPFVSSWGGCTGNVNGRPNLALDADADREISTFSHELFETITDPLTDGIWTDPDGGAGEIADKCNQHFDSAANADGSNLTLHGNLYNVQPEWSNATMNALGGVAFGGCTHAYKPADMDIVKNGPATVYAGASFDYTIDVKSNTSPTAETPHFTDPLGAKLQFVAITKPADWTCNTPSVGTTGNIDCFKTNSSAHNDGFMTAGQTASFAVTARVTPDTANGDTVSNTGTINWDTKYTQNLDAVSNVHLSESSEVSSQVITLADVTLSKATVGAAVAGSDFSYVLDVENAGPSNAQDVVVTDHLPPGTTLVSVASSGNFSCGGTTTVICTVASLDAGGVTSITINLKISPSATGTLTNTAGVTSTTSDPNPDNNIDTVSTFINTEADLAVTKTGPSTPIAGSNVTYTINATNLGPSDAQTVVLSDAIVAPATFVSISTPAGWTPCVTPAVGGTGLITCNKTTLAAAASSTFTLIVHLSPSTPSGTQLCNTATLASATTDPVSADNSSKACGTVQTLADLTLAQTSTKVGKPGNGTAIFTLTVTNNGPSDSQNVSLVANSSLFEGPKVSVNTSNGGTCTVAVQNVTCTWIPGLALGASDQVVISVPWKSAVGDVCDSATLTSGTPDPNATNNVSTACISKK